MSTKTYTYGTKPSTKEHQDIKLVRNLASQHLNEKEDYVHISKHALTQASKRKIKIRKALEIIAEGYFVEYQEVPSHKKKPDATVFYDGHVSKICSVNSIADIGNQSITLITVEHRDDTIWDVRGEYIVRK